MQDRGRQMYTLTLIPTIRRSLRLPGP